MSYEYGFVRHQITIADGSQAWDIDHPDRVDEFGVKLRLSKEVEAQFPDWSFVLKSEGTGLLVCSEELCPDPEALNQTVEDHQNNV